MATVPCWKQTRSQLAMERRQNKWHEVKEKGRVQFNDDEEEGKTGRERDPRTCEQTASDRDPRIPEQTVSKLDPRTRFEES